MHFNGNGNNANGSIAHAAAAAAAHPTTTSNGQMCTFVARNECARAWSVMPLQHYHRNIQTYTHVVYKLKPNEINAKMRKYTKSKWENEIITTKKKLILTHRFGSTEKEKINKTCFHFDVA